MPRYLISSAFKRKKLVSLFVTLGRYKQFICQCLQVKIAKMRPLMKVPTSRIIAWNQGKLTIAIGQQAGEAPSPVAQPPFFFSLFPFASTVWP
jgi:hypothetical protein